MAGEFRSVSGQPKGKARQEAAMSMRSPRGRRFTADRAGSRPRARGRGLARSIRLFRLEQTEPEAFYCGLAEDSADQVARHAELAGSTVIDVGGGAGYFTSA